jgi:hypothetical protein
MKLISVGQNKFAIVDDEDFDRLNKIRWCIRNDRGRNDYVQTTKYLGKINNKYKNVTIQMHRLILDISDSRKIDHKNGNTLDNRKENLRIATSRKNNTNLHKLKSNNTSGFRGVIKRHDYIDKITWRARINLPNGRKKSLGEFSTPEEAAKAFDKAALEIYGDFCGQLNFYKNEK